MPILTVEELNQRGAGKLPGHLGIVVTLATPQRMCAEFQVRPELMAPNGYLHAGSLITLADTMCGYGCLLNLPEGAGGFTTVELKSNHLGTTLDGTVAAVATPLHLGRTTQVWDAVVTHVQSGRTLALFRCTQMLLYPKAA
ncbi:MAG: PaaI family thioesterase [Rubrivivax sp.]|nr:PaaI family thioesterase [Rubrivivax sp.]